MREARGSTISMSGSKRLLRITWPFLAIVAVLVLLASESLKILSATRAYVGGESLWSKAQKEAVYSLNRYAQTGADADYADYRTAIVVPLGDRRARLELEKPEPDTAVAREGFVAGRNDPDDIDGMITLFRRFRDVSFMKQAIAIWAQGDELISELGAAAADLRERVISGDARPERLGPVLTRIDEINRRLTVLEEAFSRKLGEGSRLTQEILVIAMVLTATVLVVAGAAMSRRMLRTSETLEQALRASEERFDLAVEGSNDGIWDWNVRTGEVYYSARYKELLGYAGDEFPHQIETFLDLLHPDDREVRLAALNEHRKHGIPYDAEFRLRTRSGGYRWFQSRGKSVRNAQGDAIRMAGAISDVTDRKLAEAQLYAERDRARVTLRSIAEAVITTNADGRVELLNPAAQSLTGWTTADAVGLPLDAVFRIADGANGKVPIDPMAALLREARSVEWGGHTVLIQRTGSDIDINASAAPIRDRDGAIIGAVVVFHDVTDERRSAAQLSYQARHDELTGLVNRREFEHQLSRALTGASELDRRHAVLYLDLDRFKAVNDSCGHMAGDELLREIGALLQRKLREGDTLARLGGDEFGVLLENCAPESAARIAEALREAVASFHFSWHGQRFELGISIGLVPISGHGRSVTEVLRTADLCCYIAKGAGRNRVHMRQPQDDVERRHRA
jgi:diguanylate cyclase (GGDEF)-like protein/PAS domain S-box-containing protein